MTLQDWIMTQIDLRAEVTVKLGRSQDGLAASLMTWSDKADGMHFWHVEGDNVRHIAFVGSD